MIPLRILLIEDEEADYLLISRHLRTSGLAAALHWAKDGPALAEALETGDWDLILSDYKVTGLDFHDTLRRLATRLPHAPVLLVSGNTGEETAAELLKSGVTDFILKDSLARLIPAIERSLNEAAEKRRREEAEAQLRQREEEYRRLSLAYRALLDNVPDGIVHLSPELKVRWVNTAARQMFCLGEDALTADSPCYAAFWQHDGPCPACPVVDCLASHRNEIGYLVPQGDNREFEIRAIPITDHRGGIEGIIEIVRNITDHRRLEEQFRQAQKMESIGTLAGGIAHDFNNILSAILGYAEIALDDLAENHPARKSVHTILEAGLRASHLTKDLLMFSRKQASRKEPIDLNQMITRIEKFIRRVIGEDIQFETRLAKEELNVFADSHQLDQVLMNFATNARDAMPGGGYLTIATERLELDQNFIDRHGFGHPGPYVRIAVADTGKGMDQRTAAKIFDPFFTTKEMGKGTGLGLSVVYGIVTEHQGHIAVESELGKGATFMVYLPLSEESRQEEQGKGRRERVRGGTETILLAEDDGAVRQLYARVLKQFGYSVLTAMNGEEAVRLFTEHRDGVDLLIFDLVMPKMNGKQALEAIHRMKPQVKGIFISGYAPENIQQKKLLDLHAEILYKPVSPKELLRTVRTILDAP
ncbi:MAG: response regulator [Desulfobulbus sp.]|jgi:PAS domain S-box-containing protein|uniref:hybrid sensor histidine kinase/response regulator n=1 Tax=Desulfobulbus sp. TaxID=895 RepID=UPI00284A3CFB|nr:response regulator [Desulfobulbus sp.]MDR2550436.1 response regulator [Desulfobulbus sp.]